MGAGNSKKKKNIKDSNPLQDGAKRENSFVNGKQYKIVMLGEGGVGKTSISMRFISDYFITDYDPTIEDSYIKEYTIDGKDIRIEILDTAGQEVYTSGCNDKVFRIGDGFVVIYSITSRESFNRISELREKIIWARDTEQIPMIIVANKCDAERERKVSIQEGKDLAAELNCQFIETSAKSNLNITECINVILKEIIKP